MNSATHPSPRLMATLPSHEAMLEFHRAAAVARREAMSEAASTLVDSTIHFARVFPRAFNAASEAFGRELRTH